MTYYAICTCTYVCHMTYNCIYRSAHPGIRVPQELQLHVEKIAEAMVHIGDDIHYC